jgi:hypothetical protein
MRLIQAEYQEARRALQEHEKKHYPLKSQYDRSLAELERLTRACSEAWDEMVQASR